jgi:hypothetical protein
VTRLTWVKPSRYGTRFHFMNLWAMRLVCVLLALICVTYAQNAFLISTRARFRNLQAQQWESSGYDWGKYLSLVSYNLYYKIVQILLCTVVLRHLLTNTSSIAALMHRRMRASGVLLDAEREVRLNRRTQRLRTATGTTTRSSTSTRRRQGRSLLSFSSAILCFFT